MENEKRKLLIKKIILGTAAVLGIGAVIVLSKKNNSLKKDKSILEGKIMNMETLIHGQTKTINKLNYQLGKLSSINEQQ